jgi:energy-coupling factor transporter ATP-binding protein EcfA2
VIDVYEQLLEALTSDDGPPDALADTVLAAADSEAALAEHLDSSEPPARREPAPADDQPNPARVFLNEIAVTNFRGVGERARLPLQPGPGLTVVIGRNGSGKSSFAEGLELLLTGHNLRWDGKAPPWKAGWRNLHGAGATKLEATFSVDGSQQPLKVVQSWTKDAALDAPDGLAVTGPQSDWDELGWAGQMQRYRPFLSYSELSTMFSERAAELYDALSSILGLEPVEAVQATLRKARLARSETGKSEKAARAALKNALAPVEDDRATVAKEQLAKTKPDRVAVASSLVDPSQDEDLTQLRALVALPVPAAEQVDRVRADQRAAHDKLHELEATDAERDRQMADLLEAAVAFHVHSGPTCPICQTPDVLDESWSLRAQADVADLRNRSQELQASRRAVADADRAVQTLFAANTAQVLRAVSLDTTAVQDLWDHADRDAHALRAALEGVQTEAKAELIRRDTAWRPVHAQISNWISLAEAAAADVDHVKALLAAEDWMKEYTAALRKERLKPVVDAARSNWDQLRHESNVELGEFALKKAGNNVRSATFDVTVDGSDASAFGVMSQGELSALAISVFLPRASLPESPFGFVVIDDPVQAMDPAKVDGLAKVFAEAAKTQQVVVFTHDDRLPRAIERLSIDARIIDVKRRAQSKVEVVKYSVPSERYINEAFALCKAESLDPEVRDRVVPAFCRSAIEAACDGAIRRRGHASGASHEEIETRLEGLTSLNTWLAEAFGASVAQVTDKVRSVGGEDAVKIVAAAKSGSHKPIDGDILTLVRGAERLVTKLEAV